jgi:hypothetical protein
MLPDRGQFELSLHRIELLDVAEFEAQRLRSGEAQGEESEAIIKRSEELTPQITPRGWRLPLAQRRLTIT